MRITKNFHFEASHVVPAHPGKCRRLHGHSYFIQITLYGCVDPVTGFIIDFADLKGMVQPLVETLDHRHLNFFIENPTAENIAAWFGQRLSRAVDGVIITGLLVTVSETSTSSATWDSRQAVDKRQGQNPSLYGIGIPQVCTEGEQTVRIGPAMISNKEYREYMELFEYSRRAVGNMINTIRSSSLKLWPAGLAEVSGSVKEQK